METQLVRLRAGWTEEAESPGRRLVQSSREDMKVSGLGGNREIVEKWTDQVVFWSCSRRAGPMR